MVNESVMRWPAIFMLSLMLGACASTARVPEDHFYRLESGASSKALATPLLDGTLEIQGGTSAPIYRDRSLLYSESGTPAQLQRYHYQHWIDTPPQLVQRSLADYLRAAGVAPTVVTPETGVDARYRLRVDIDRFEHVRGRDGGQVAVDLRITLTERNTARLLMQTVLQGERTVHGSNFDAVVETYRQLLAEQYGQLVARLHELRNTSR